MVNQAGLWLICGVRPAPGDPNSAETGPYGDGLYVLDFSGTGEFGISVDDWIAQIVQPRTVSQGDNILRYEYPPVTEVINLLLNSCTSLTYAALLSKLARFQQLIANFWTGTGIHPVYLKWQAAGSPGPQYALARNLNYVDKTSAVLGVTSGALVLTIEREPFWRGVAPGENPKEWTLEQAGLTRGGTGYTYSDMELYSGTNHLAYGTVQNRHEWDPTDYLTTLSKNYVDIPGADIPGDAPALVCLDVKGEFDDLYAWISTNPRTATTRDTSPTEYGATLSFNGGDAVFASGGVTRTNSANGNKSGGTTSGKYLSCSGSTDTIIKWKNYYSPNSWGLIDTVLLRGKYAVLMRHSTTTANLPMRFSVISTRNGSDEVVITETDLVYSTATSGVWATVCLGTITIPGEKILNSPEGYGQHVLSQGEAGLTLQLKITGGVAYTVSVLDITLVKIDEGAVKAVGTRYPYSHVMFDNTGYLTRSQGDAALEFYTDNITPDLVRGNPRYTEISGSGLMLSPGKDSRIYIYGESGSLPTVDNLLAYDIYLNIVPRWTGRRDV